MVAPDVRLIVAPDAQREMEEVAARVRALVDGGVPPHRIAVVAREARPQLPMVAAALERFGLPVTARLRTGLDEVPVVRAVLALLDVAAGGWTRHGLVELADQPYLGVELDAVAINALGYRERIEGLAQWEAGLERLLLEARAREAKEAAGESEQNGYARPLPPSWRVEKALTQLGALRERFGTLLEPRSLTEWTAWLQELVAEKAATTDASTPPAARPWRLVDAVYDAPPGREAVVRLDLAGLKGLSGIAQGWSEALARWGGGDVLLDVDAFAAWLREELDADVALWTGTRRGVQVLEALAAAYRSFDHVFLVGLEAGRFPRQAGRSPLLDSVEREALIAAGLPLNGRAAWDDRERELFRSVVAAVPGAAGRAGVDGARSVAPSLTVSYSRLDEAGREVAKSSFLEALEDVVQPVAEEIPAARVLTPGLPLCPPERLPDAERVARLERRRQAGHAFPGNGTIEDPELAAWLADHFGEGRTWSPTQLEEFAKCPWAYFCGRVLRLEKREDPDTELDPALRGSILHDALQRFFDAAVARAGGPVLLAEQDLPWAEPALLDALDAAIEAAGQDAWLGHPALRPARRGELRRTLKRYLQFEIEQTAAYYNNRKKASQSLRTGVMEHEKLFDDVVLEREGVRFRFRGRIDRVEVGVDERVPGDVARYVAAVDYKSTKYSTPGAGDPDAWDEGIVLQVPLYAHALAQLWPGARVARVEYRTLKSPQIVHPLELVR
ncbi:MAG TPA: PD-(D/E)XK nuclease family protein, partial [Longimicrobiales bacterium]